MISSARPYQTTIQKLETRSFALSYLERNADGDLEQHQLEVRLPVLGRLQQREREFIELDTESRPDAFGYTATLAILIAREQGLNEYEVYKLITSDASCELPPEQQAELRIKYMEAMRSTSAQIRELTHHRKRAEVTALLLGRGGLSDWTLERTAELPDSQFEPLYAFTAAEVLGEPQPAAEVEPEQFVERLKKPRKRQASPSSDTPIGSESTGNSETSGPTTNGSTPKTSRRSRSTSSTKRSPKGSNSDVLTSTP